jgi:DNA/RNA-binding domain of Phe-tRNA-synthetase-like protein
MNIIVTDKISAVCPEFVGAAVEAHVQNTTFCPELWDEINALCEDYRSRFTTVSIKEMAAIEATRRVYRACGKDPSRYRPAAEALIRRVVQGKELYQIDTLVDLINLASMKYGYSIGGFDADKFVGDTLALGVGEPGEPYEGIGRGMLNIEGMPVYRDQKGGVGTPTSDNERTKIDITTTHVLVLINGYDGNTETVSANADFVKSLLERYAGASDVVINTYKTSDL